MELGALKPIKKNPSELKGTRMSHIHRIFEAGRVSGTSIRTVTAIFTACFFCFTAILLPSHAPAQDASPAVALLSRTNPVVVFPDGKSARSPIQSAIDVVSPGTVIGLSPGIFREALKIEKDLGLRSKAGAGLETVFSSDDAGPVLEVTGNAAVRLSGLSFFKNGNGTSPWVAIGPGANVEMDGVCIGWPLSEAGRSVVEYHAKGRVAGFRSFGRLP